MDFADFDRLIRRRFFGSGSGSFLATLIRGLFLDLEHVYLENIFVKFADGKVSDETHLGVFVSLVMKILSGFTASILGSRTNLTGRIKNNTNFRSPEPASGVR